MAKNWNLGELVDAVVANDVAGIQDVGRRFPVATTLMAKIVNGDRDAIVMLMHAMPDHLTVRKINSALTDGVEDNAEENDEANEVEEAVEEKPKTKRGRKATKVEDEDNDDKDEKPVKKVKKTAKNDDEETGYEGKTARELFELCNERGLKAEPKKPISYYIAMLEDADKKASKKEDNEEEDDWDI